MTVLGDYDLAGFAVGAIERGCILPRKSSICAGDILLGLASSGVHSNGYSLIHKIVVNEKLSYFSSSPWDANTTLGKSLLEPTHIYVKQVLPAIKKGMIKALAHITGGGFVDNVPRVLPDNVTAVIDTCSWPMPAVFKWISNAGNVTPGIQIY
jgi:phosphoribosylamine--glycine ligase/phosphoribosylformylglycinamidine cyclo-ligase